MDTLTFIERVAAAVAWPVTVLVLAFLFKRSVERLLPRLLEFKSGRLSVKLAAAEQKLNAVKYSPLEAPANLPTPANLPVTPPTSAGRILFKELDPSRYESRDETRAERHSNRRSMTGVPHTDLSLEVETHWKRLRASVLKTARKHGVTTRSPSGAIEELLEAGVVPAAFEVAFGRVKSSRDALKNAPPWLIERKLVVDSARHATD
jgi:hypothetical protein